MKFITLSNLQALATKIKELYVAKEDGKGLSENDLTNVMKANYDTAYDHSQEAHAPSGAEANIIESVKVNGETLVIADKAVDIALDGYLREIDIEAVTVEEINALFA